MADTLERVGEGTTTVYVVSGARSSQGPGKRGHGPFYNPAMQLNRDLSILFTQWLIDTTGSNVLLCDGLAASGIRGVRIAHENTGDFTVTINDASPDAYSFIQKNIQLNSCDNAVATNENLNFLLSGNRFDYIDVDPFGSPVYFFDSAVRSIRNHGVIACTATDTATLCGVYPKVCARRYGAVPYHTYMMHEIGLRILIGALCREAAKYDKGIQPLLCYATDHYFRMYIQIIRGKEHADESIRLYQQVPAKNIPLFQDTSKKSVGPLWMGRLQNKQVIQLLRTMLFRRLLQTKHDLWHLLMLLEDEAEAPPFFYTTTDLASHLKTSAPKIHYLLEMLRSTGAVVTRTHFSMTGFRTTASFDVVKQVFLTHRL